MKDPEYITMLRKQITAVFPEFSSTDDLVNTLRPYPELIRPLLNALAHYLDMESGKLEFIIRALTVKEAKGMANKPLLECVFSLAGKDPGKLERILWVVGNAFTVIIEPEDTLPIGRILQTKAFGRGREMFALALGRIRTPEAERILIACLADEDTAAHAIGALKNMRSLMAFPYVLEKKESLAFLERREALKYLAAFEKWK